MNWLEILFTSWWMYRPLPDRKPKGKRIQEPEKKREPSYYDDFLKDVKVECEK